MPQPRLTEAQLRETLALVEQHGKNAYRHSGLPYNTFRSRLSCARAWQDETYVPAPERKPASYRPPVTTQQADAAIDEPEPADGPIHSTLFDQRWETFTKWIGRSAPSRPPKRLPGQSRKVILHTGDWHIPYMQEEAFHATLEANDDADICVVGGDALNCSAFSRFIESELVHPRDEFAKLTLALQAVAERYPDVRVNIGNHPDRIRKYLAKRLDPWALFLCQVNPIQFVVEGLRKEHGIDNIKVAQPVIPDLDSSNWLTLIGDCAFTHAETHGKLHLRPAENTARWLRKWDRHLPVRPRVVVQEHNHRAGLFYDDELQALLIQAPCLSRNVAYQTAGDLKYSPNQHGFVRIVQVDGVTQINESRFYLLDETGEARAA